MESSTYLEVIMPGETQTGYSLCVVSTKCADDDWIFKSLSCGTLQKCSVCCRFTGFLWEPPASFGRKWGTLKDFLHPARTSLGAGFTRIGERCGCMLMNFCKLVLIDRQPFRTPFGKDSVPQAGVTCIITNFQKKFLVWKNFFWSHLPVFRACSWRSGCP